MGARFSRDIRHEREATRHEAFQRARERQQSTAVARPEDAHVHNLIDQQLQREGGSFVKADYIAILARLTGIDQPLSLQSMTCDELRAAIRLNVYTEPELPAGPHAQPPYPHAQPQAPYPHPQPQLPYPHPQPQVPYPHPQPQLPYPQPQPQAPYPHPQPQPPYPHAQPQPPYPHAQPQPPYPHAQPQHLHISSDCPPQYTPSAPPADVPHKQ